MTLLASFADTLFSLARPLVHASDAEAAHGLTITALERMPRARCAVTSPMLETTVAGIPFPNPVGLAPGFDKDGRVPSVMPHFGFGFVEVGTLTPLPQAGNPRPRLFRLTQDRAVINRLGFNNGGQSAAVPRLARARRSGLAVPLGVNIGANKDAADRILDYVNGLAAMADLADYITVNISSPNTLGLRALQDKGALEELLDGVLGLRSAPDYAVPVFLKVAPDLTAADIDDITHIALRRGLDALIVSNTTITRPPLADAQGSETGGLSGAPLRDLAQQRLVDFRKASGGAIPLIGVGGIASADDAWARIRAGASLVQLYSALVFEGPGLAGRIARGLEALARRDGFARVADAVGVDG